MMLCKRGTTADLTREGWLYDLKIDGVRVCAAVANGKVTLMSRSGVDCTYQYPEIVAALAEAFPKGTWVFDGEIAVNDERGLPSWPLTHKRNAQVKQAAGWAAKLPATYYLFDLLQDNGMDIRRYALANRRQALRSAIACWTSNPSGSERLQLVLNGYDGEAMWSVVEQFNLEGLVAKRQDSAYRDGRSSDWVKIKHVQTITCLVGGYDPGEGFRAETFGALHLYLVDGDRLVQVGKVGSGFSNQELLQVMQALHHPPTIVEVQYLDVSPDGQLRQPVFARLRSDAGVEDCTTDQLDSEGSHT